MTFNHKDGYKLGSVWLNLFSSKGSMLLDSLTLQTHTTA